MVKDIAQLIVLILLFYLRQGSESTDLVWTAWCNEGSPDNAGVELERLDTVRIERCPDVCSNPHDIQCRLVESHTAWNETGDIFRDNCRLNGGLSCLNADQTDGQCGDYEVRYLCPDVIEVNGSGQFWTDWCDEDNPFGRGDEEVRNYCPDVCAEPLSTDCRVKRTHDKWNETGDVIRIPCTAEGLSCFNADQPAERCQDYEIRFLCNSECDGQCGSGTRCIRNSYDSLTYCVCKEGFNNRRQNPLTKVFTCVDFADCASLGSPESKCRDNSRCVNSEVDNDNYSCVCDLGYSLTSSWFRSEQRYVYSCTDIDECLGSPCGTSGNCTNTLGGYQCQCDTSSTVMSTDGRYCEPRVSAQKAPEETETSATLYVGVGIGIGLALAITTVVGAVFIRRCLRHRSGVISPSSDKPLTP